MKRGSGGSRAAKRRAKKASKRPKRETDIVGSQPKELSDPPLSEKKQVKKKKKSSLWSDDEEEDVKASRDSSFEALSHHEPASLQADGDDHDDDLNGHQNDDDDDNDNDNDNDDDDDDGHEDDDNKYAASADDDSSSEGSDDLDPPMSEVSDFLFSSLISPHSTSTFYAAYNEKKPLHISRGDDPSASHSPLLTKEGIVTLLSKHSLKYGVDVNVTNVVEGKRRTLDLLPSKPGDPPVVAKVEDVMSNFESGCSVRLLCPQQFSEEVWEVCSILESEFGCMVGANAYLTPRGSQGFAPHYDDVDVFVLQQEGKKRWRIYEPFTKR